VLSITLIILLSYLVGSVPGSLLIGKYLYGVDPREHGSGNAGATNTMRVLGMKAGIMATVVDLGKGLFAAGVIATIRIDVIPVTGLGFWDTMSVMRLIAGVAAVAGHMYPVLAGFRGGKGVNTSAGVLLAITPVTMLFTFGVFFIVLYLSRYVSLASLAAALAFPSTVVIRKYLFHVNSIDASILFFSLALATAIFIAHRPNIQRLLRGEETRVSSGMLSAGSTSKE
jgi:glycerol-3-phosphate acyltransferase PlsY